MGEGGMKKERGLASLARHLFLLKHAWLPISLMLVWLTACASGPRVVDHAFEFSASSDSPGMEVLDFRYGDSKMPGTRASLDKLRNGRPTGGTGINGPMPLGDSLYVKWRIKSTGAVYEDTVDLKSRLPEDITGQRIYFIVSGPQLHVYLIGSERLNPNPCPSREELRRLGTSDAPWDKIFSTYCYRKITVIYPDQSQPQATK
jgi:hypothetical protein